VNPTEHAASDLPRAGGFLATVRNLIHAEGISAPRITRRLSLLACLPACLCFGGIGALKFTRGFVLPALLATVLALAFSAAPAAADPACTPELFAKHEGCQFASGAGEPTAVAVNGDMTSSSFGDLYVEDRVNNRVDEFSGEGAFVRAFGWKVNLKEPREELQVCTPATGCQAGTSGGGAGQLTQPESLGGIAVDGNPADLSAGDVYVLDRNEAGIRVEKFTAEGHFERQWPVSVSAQSVAVGPTGTVYVGESEAVQEYDPETGAPGVRLPLAGAGGISDLVVNSESEIYGTEAGIGEGNGQTHPVRHYSATGLALGEMAECGGVPGEFDCENEGVAASLALTPTGEVYINQRLATGTSQLRRFSPAGIQVSEFATPAGELGYGLGFDALTGALYTLNTSSQVLVIVPPERGPIVAEELADRLEPTAAVVHAVINPEPAGVCGETHYTAQYGLNTKYEGVAPPEGTLAATFAQDPVEGTLKGLTPHTLYHYRFLATEECEVNPVGEPGVKTTFTSKGEDATFTTQPPALVEEEFSTDVRSTSATLHASIDPLGSASEYRFEYDTRPYALGEGAHGVSLPVPDEQVGSGKAPVPVEQHVNGLTAGQVYHYRVVVTNALEKAPGEVQGEDRAFTTQTGGEAGLPDGRGWELVSPPDKQGAQLFGAEEHSFTQAAADGSGVVYNASAPTESQPRGNGEEMQILAGRTSTGWGNHDLAIPHSFPIGVTPREAYRAFSPDLSAGVLQPQGAFEPALSREATEQTAYLRDSSTGAYTPLVIGCRPEGGECPAGRNDTTNPFVPFGEEVAGEGPCLKVDCGPEFLGASPDFSHIVLRDGHNRHAAPLLQGTPAESLYEWAAGKLALVSQPPENTPEVVGAPTLGGDGGRITPHAVSTDGSRVFWGVGNRPERVLFMRDMTRKETIEIGSGEADFERANAAGTLVFYSGKECEILLGVKGLECRPVETEGKAVEDGTVLTTSEDGSWVYFRQGGGNHFEGGDIYARHGSEAPKLVASNIGNILPDTAAEIDLPEDPWRASPNGEWFAFMSDGRLTGYDNRDAVTGQPDEEVYLYNAAGGGRLVCASCDPTGARPHGAPPGHMLLADYAVHWGEEENRLLAATIPGWTPYETNHAVYDPRFLSDSGRLFFNSVGGLVPRDVNERVDTYELEPPGVGGCTTSTQIGTVIYSPAAGGCVALISSGESSEESVFADASETGDDVFFLSSSRLSPADLDGSLSLWDARVCTGASPCVPAPAAPVPPCSTEASCKPSQSPQPQIYGPPASATFSGPGNPTPPPPAAGGKPKTAEQVRIEKLAMALRACHAKHNRHRRKACEKQARKTYAKKAKAKRATNDRRAK